MEKTQPEGRREIGTQEVKGVKVFVGNLSYKTTWQDLKDVMKKAGNVLRADIFQDYMGRSKGIGIVEFGNAVEANEAIKLFNETEVDGRTIFVRENKEREGGDNRGGDRGGRGGGRGRGGYNNYENREGGGRRGYDREEGGSYGGGRGGFRGGRGGYRGGGEGGYRGGEGGYRGGRGRGGYSRGGGGGGHIERNYGGEGRKESGDRYDKGENRPPREPREHQPGFQIIVLNLPWSISWQDLKDSFTEFGSVTRADIPRDDRGRSKGFGFVTFEKEKDANDAIAKMNGTEFEGREIRVEHKKERRN